jgi:hypothetical protein
METHFFIKSSLKDWIELENADGQGARWLAAHGCTRPAGVRSPASHSLINASNEGWVRGAISKKQIELENQNPVARLSFPQHH